MGVPASNASELHTRPLGNCTQAARGIANSIDEARLARAWTLKGPSLLAADAVAVAIEAVAIGRAYDRRTSYASCGSPPLSRSSAR